MLYYALATICKISRSIQYRCFFFHTQKRGKKENSRFASRILVLGIWTQVLLSSDLSMSSTDRTEKRKNTKTFHSVDNVHCGTVRRTTTYSSSCIVRYCSCKQDQRTHTTRMQYCTFQTRIVEDNRRGKKNNRLL